MLIFFNYKKYIFFYYLLFFLFPFNFLIALESSEKKTEYNDKIFFLILESEDHFL